MPDDVLTSEAFEAQLTWLSTHGYHFISVDQVLRGHRGQGRLPAHPLLLSFDDGYISSYTKAFPVLLRPRAPAGTRRGGGGGPLVGTQWRPGALRGCLAAVGAAAELAATGKCTAWSNRLPSPTAWRAEGTALWPPMTPKSHKRR